MAAIEIILQRMTWASCFCLALTLYSNSVPTRTLPTKLGETTQPNQEISSRIESQSHYTYLLTRNVSAECGEKFCPQPPLK